MTSFCCNCTAVARWEVKPEDPNRDNEFCKECGPWVTRLVSAEKQIKEAEIGIEAALGKRSVEGRALKTIHTERLVEAEAMRRVAREKLYAISMHRKSEMKIVAGKN